MPAVEMDNAAVRGLLGSAVSRVSDYSVCFVLPTATNGLLDSSLGGSGTPVVIDEVRNFDRLSFRPTAQDEQGCRLSSSDSKQTTSPHLIQIERFFSSFILSPGRSSEWT